MMLVLLAMLLLESAPPPGCSIAKIAASYNAANNDPIKYAAVERSALACASKEQPRFYYFAAQAQGKQKHWDAQIKTLNLFLKYASADDPNRGTAESMRKAARQRSTPRPPVKSPVKPPNDGTELTPEQPPPPDDSAEKPPEPSLTPPVDKPADPAPVPSAEPTLDTDPPQDEVTPVDASRNRMARKHLWVGLGAVAGATVLGSVTTGLIGYFAFTRSAMQRNKQAIRDAGLPDDFDYGSCLPADCDRAEKLEDKQYPSNEYYRELIKGVTAESVATGLGGASLGIALSALPEVAPNQRRRKIGFGVLLGGGLMMTGLGAALVGVVGAHLNAGFAGFDAIDNPDGWRFRNEAYTDLRRSYLLASAVTGFGVGLTLGSSVAFAVRGRDPSTRGSKPTVRVVPTFNGLVLSGSF